MSNPFSEEWLEQRNREVMGLRTPLIPVQVEPPMLEAQIEAECSKHLEEDGWRALRTDPVSDRSRGKGFGEVGMADHLYLRYAYSGTHCSAGSGASTGAWDINARVLHSQVMWIEFKRPGEKAKKHQRDWHAKERARGALTLIAGEDFPATVDGFKEWYAGSGLQRRRA